MKTVWHSGPPPEIGWWPASTDKNRNSLRWWNGKFWSEWVNCFYSAESAAFYASRKEPDQKHILWTGRWWV